jgi:hypothetical protein
MNKELAAQKIRARLERRIAAFLGCEVGDLPRMKIGTLVHMLFLLFGDTEDVGGFSTSMAGVLQILGNEVVWDLETKVEEEMPKATVVN